VCLCAFELNGVLMRHGQTVTQGMKNRFEDNSQ
jgi:hypothetical protein